MDPEVVMEVNQEDMLWAECETKPLEEQREMIIESTIMAEKPEESNNPANKAEKENDVVPEKKS